MMLNSMDKIAKLVEREVRAGTVAEGEGQKLHSFAESFAAAMTRS